MPFHKEAKEAATQMQVDERQAGHTPGQSLVDLIMEGLQEASPEGRGFQKVHMDAVNLANAAPQLLDCLYAVKSTVHFKAMSEPLQEQINAAILKGESGQ